MIWYIRQLSHAYMLPSVSQKQFPFSSRVLFVYAFYAYVSAFSDRYFYNPLDDALGLIY